ncbi:hypothetical protein ABBQ32_002836 [Trebouxia sp. C0010 RCD-2024]
MSPLILAQVLTPPSRLPPNPLSHVAPPSSLLFKLQATCLLLIPPQSGTGAEASFSQLAPGTLIAVWMHAYVYYSYPVALFAILLIGSGASSYLLYCQRLRLVSMATQRHLVPLLHQKFVRALLSKQLVPGDVIVVQRGRVTCDMVLLRGTCLVEESMLSGEVWASGNPRKHEPFKRALIEFGQAGVRLVRKVSHPEGVRYDPDVNRSSTLHAGSHVQQVWVDDDEQDESIAMVVRTGEYTTTGNMLRSLIHNDLDATSMSLKDNHTRDCFKFMGCSLALNLFIFITAYLIHYIIHRHEGSTADIFLQLLRFVLNALPPLLGSLLVMLRFVTVLRLRRQNIFMSDTRKLRTASQLDLVLFDKTGTLTVGQGHLHGLVTCEEGKLGGTLKMEAVTWSGEMRIAIALCNDLIPLKNCRRVIGPDSEKKAFADVEAAFVGRNSICLPMRRHPEEAARFMTLHVLHRLEFDAEYLMSGVIIETASARHEPPQIFLKGSVHAVVQLVAHNRLPSDWAHVMMSWNAMGYRTMGVVSGKIVVQDRLDVSKITLANVNNYVREMSLLGILVFDNPLRSDSIAAIAELQQTARLKTMMVTGDHSMTGIAASQQIGLLGKGQPIVVFDKQAPKKGLPGPSELRDSLDMAPTLKAQAVSGLSKTPHAAPHRSLAPAVGRASLSALTSSRQSSSSVSTVEAADAAAFRASLRRSHSMLAMPAEMSTSSPSSLAASTAALPAAVAWAAGDSPTAVAAFEAGARSVPSLSFNSAVQASAALSVASNEPAVALAASSILFKSTLLPAPAALSAAGLSSAASSAAASAPAAAKIVSKTKTPSPLLASYLRSVSGAKPQSSPQPTAMQEQQPEAAPPNGRTPSADEQPSHAHVTHAESHKASRFSSQASGLQASGTDAASPGLDQLSSPRSSGARLSQGLPQTDLRSPPRAHRPRQSPFDNFPQLKVHSELQPQDLSPLSPTSPTQLRSCLKGSAQPHSPRQELAESDWQQQRRKTSADMRAWAVEQSEKQQSLSLQGLALSAIRQNLEMQSGHR